MPNTSSKEIFGDEKYLRPVIEDDALLYSLDDLDSVEPSEAVNQYLGQDRSQQGPDSGLLARVAELEAELCSLHMKMTDYRETVAKVLDDRWASAEVDQYPKAQLSKGGQTTAPLRDNDSHYFKSYSYNGMLLTRAKSALC